MDLPVDANAISGWKFTKIRGAQIGCRHFSHFIIRLKIRSDLLTLIMLIISNADEILHGLYFIQGKVHARMYA